MSAQFDGSDKNSNPNPSSITPEMPESSLNNTNNTNNNNNSNNIQNEETTATPIILAPTTTPSTNTTSVDKGTSTTRQQQQQQQQQDEFKKRPYMPKFATIHTDKYPQNLRREFPMSNFDRNLTVEKARFDPQPNDHKEIPPPAPPSSSSPPHLVSDQLQPQPQQPQLQHPPRPASPPIVTPSSITPSVSSNGIHTPSSTFSVPNTKPTRPPTKSKSEGDRTTRNSVKKRRRPPPPMTGTATPAEVFHRNLIDAVSNVEDSDENEQYVYSYGGTTIDHTSYHSDLVYRPQSIRSSPASPMHDSRRVSPLSRTSSFFGDLFRSLTRQQHQQQQQQQMHSHPHHHQAGSVLLDEEENISQPHRPKLRSNVMDHRPKQLQGSETWEPHQWYDNKHSMRATPPHLLGLPPPSAAHHHPIPETTTTRHNRQRIYPEAYHTDGYSSDDEGAPLLFRRSKGGRRYRHMNGNNDNNKKRPWPRIVGNIMCGLLLAALGLLFLVIYRARPLTDISVEMGRVLASDKELIFDLRVKANNWNWWTVQVADADISVFAFSQVVPLDYYDDNNENNNSTTVLPHGVDPAEYLGSFYRFDEPLLFSPAMISSEEPFEASSQIRIKSPGADESGNQRWSRIIRYQYGLVARGVLKYRPLPFGSFYRQSAAICDVARVDPTTGVVSEDPDQSYCLKDGKKLIKNPPSPS
ncbi:hypothetical protein BDA99DRAFT_343236 [Phascolomyces articulosus]|uniref:Vac7p n=1 Tax=Phascolomyces articulosus TaxID=60185 RepID=A0AAD5PGF3_9FUNG|nr:hypothetical protein BDA99DRAFT_343236 [Phascolomyces articulosus]